MTERSSSRREFLATAAAGSAALLAARYASAAPSTKFNLGIQSYSLREFDAVTAMKHTQTLGLKFWEAFPGHLPMSSVPAKIQEQKDQLAAHGVTVMSWGVVGFSADETKARQVFDFAKALGLKSVSADPEKNAATFDLLDKLVEEYKVAIAIHNHGPGHRYNKISDVLEMVKDRHPLIGGCVDTGHYLRSDESPVEAIQKLGKRVFGVHLKDVKTITEGGAPKKHFKILGEGDLDVKGCFQALKTLDYQYCVAIEYEENPKNPLSDLEVCLKTIRTALEGV